MARFYIDRFLGLKIRLGGPPLPAWGLADGWKDGHRLTKRGSTESEAVLVDG